MHPDIEDTVTDLQQLFSSLNRLASRARMRRALHPEVQRLTATEAWLLTHLAEVGPTRMSALAQWQCVDRSTMTAQVKRLEAAGLATREVDPRDRRAALVSLTDQGRQACQSLRDGAAAFFTEALADWTPAQRRDLVEVLTRFREAIEAQLDLSS